MNEKLFKLILCINAYYTLCNKIKNPKHQELQKLHPVSLVYSGQSTLTLAIRHKSLGGVSEMTLAFNKSILIIIYINI